MGEVAADLLQWLGRDGVDDDAIAPKIWADLNSGERDTLLALWRGNPVEDGDIPSKVGRDALLSLGLAVRCCVCGEQGYTAASYLAGTLLASLPFGFLGG